MAARLKVYRTAIGFHDAYVAATSQQAALAAWGTDKPLFARGAAEVVTDPALTAEPLARPGEVVRRLRGSAAEQIAALPPDRPKPAAAKQRPTKETPKPKPKRKTKPSRAELDAAERAADAMDAQHAAESAELDERERALRQERKALDRRQAGELARLTAERDAARARYDAALRRWQG